MAKHPKPRQVNHEVGRFLHENLTMAQERFLKSTSNMIREIDPSSTIRSGETRVRPDGSPAKNITTVGKARKRIQRADPRPARKKTELAPPSRRSMAELRKTRKVK